MRSEGVKTLHSERHVRAPMLGFAPLSTFPISAVARSNVATTPTGGGGDGGARQLTKHERRRRQAHQRQLADWQSRFQAMLA